MQIDITADTPKIVKVNLVGKTYEVRVPKTSASLGLARAAKSMDKKDVETIESMINQYIEIVFKKADAPKVIKRLQEPSDALDFPHITTLISELSKVASGRPTTSPSDSAE